jgi:hypothetical protein
MPLEISILPSKKGLGAVDPGKVQKASGTGNGSSSKHKHRWVLLPPVLLPPAVPAAVPAGNCSDFDNGSRCLCASQHTINCASSFVVCYVWLFHPHCCTALEYVITAVRCHMSCCGCLQEQESQPRWREDPQEKGSSSSSRHEGSGRRPAAAAGGGHGL